MSTVTHAACRINRRGKSLKPGIFTFNSLLHNEQSLSCPFHLYLTCYKVKLPPAPLSTYLLLTMLKMFLEVSSHLKVISGKSCLSVIVTLFFQIGLVLLGSNKLFVNSL